MVFWESMLLFIELEFFLYLLFLAWELEMGFYNEILGSLGNILGVKAEAIIYVGVGFYI